MTVSGANVPQTIAFTSAIAATYAVTFTESGLASGAPWSVTLAGNLHSSTTNTIAFTEANGTYAYTVGGVAGVCGRWGSAASGRRLAGGVAARRKGGGEAPSGRAGRSRAAFDSNMLISPAISARSYTWGLA